MDVLSNYRKVWKMSRASRVLTDEELLVRYPWIALLGWFPPAYLVVLALAGFGEVIGRLLGQEDLWEHELSAADLFLWPTRLYRGSLATRRELLRQAAKD